MSIQRTNRLTVSTLPIEVFEQTLPQFIAEVEALSETDSMRWHDLKRFVLSWCVKLRDASERQRVFQIARKTEQTLHQPELKVMPSIADSLIEEGFTKGIEQGIEQGRREATMRWRNERRELLEDMLQTQFGELPADIRDWIVQHEDSEVLRNAILRVGRMTSIDEFRNSIIHGS